MTRDISDLLNQWAFDPDQVTARVIVGVDGREKIQMRIDLGLLQMERDGRPDGQRPEACDSWLEHFERRQREHAAEDPAEPYFLESGDCLELMREGVQYYYRYLCFWHLKKYELCARDTRRNLRLFQFVRDYARHARDKMMFDQYRPYVTMMHARAVATPLVEMRQFDSALQAIDAGINGIEAFLTEYSQEHRQKTCPELSQLKRWREEVELERDSQTDALTKRVEFLRRELDRAVRDERFEIAARLRDEIRTLSDPSAST